MNGKASLHIDRDRATLFVVVLGGLLMTIGVGLLGGIAAALIVMGGLLLGFGVLVAALA